MITIDQRRKLTDSALQLRKIAQPVGPLHGFWDLIFDIEAFLKGRETMLRDVTAEQLIEIADKELAKH